MKDILTNLKAANTALLDEQLRAALGDHVSGVSTGPDGLVVHLSWLAVEGDEVVVAQVCAAHDPAGLTDEQRKLMLDEQKLEVLKTEYGQLPPLDVTKPVLEDLAVRVAWLEAHMLKLLGL